MPLDPSHQLFASNEVRTAIEAALADLRRARIVERIWRKDYSVWKPDSTEISNRLGWLDVARDMRRNAVELESFAGEIRVAGFKHVVLLGMGGSSLCPEVLRASFGPRRGYPRLIVLDSTVPAWVRRVTQAIDPARTLFIVSSKSGGTIEVMSFFKHFWSKVERKKRGNAGKNFVAITDPGTSLNALATQHGFRRTFVNPPDIGGRYSALSYFGLLPAALIGLDLPALLEPAIEMMDACRTDALANPAAWLGAAMGTLARSGRDKLTLVVSPSIGTFGLWAEQLLAESTGKDGRGIVPIALEPHGLSYLQSSDRFFVVMRVEGDVDGVPPSMLDALKNAGQPTMILELKQRYDLGAEFFRWEMATAIAGHILGIHPFDQPNVQESKDNTQRVLDQFKSTGALPDPAEPPRTPETAQLAEFLRQARPGDYLAVMAYLDGSPATARALSELRAAILERYHLPNTLGYGPRFLHSTGQLHKGGANNGLFIQLTANATRDVPVPGELFSFGVLAAAQASGDMAALHAHGRRVIRIELGANPAAGIRRLTRSIAGTLAADTRSRPRAKASIRRAAAKRNAAAKSLKTRRSRPIPTRRRPA